MKQNKSHQTTKDSKKSDYLQWEQDLNPEIQSFIHKIRREKFEKRPKNIKPLADDEFIKDCLHLMDLCTNANLINPKYSDDEILTCFKFVVFDFRCMLMKNRVKYGIKKENMALIVRLFINMMKPFYFKMLKNKDKRYFGKLEKKVKVYDGKKKSVRKGKKSKARK